MNTHTEREEDEEVHRERVAEVYCVCKTLPEKKKALYFSSHPHQKNRRYSSSCLCLSFLQSLHEEFEG